MPRLSLFVFPGSEVVLGPPAPVCYMRMPDGTPIEQAIGWQRLRPGSGCLAVKVTTDGPTRVLQIRDGGGALGKVYPNLKIRFSPGCYRTELN